MIHFNSRAACQVRHAWACICAKTNRNDVKLMLSYVMEGTGKQWWRCVELFLYLHMEYWTVAWKRSSWIINRPISDMFICQMCTCSQVLHKCLQFLKDGKLIFKSIKSRFSWESCWNISYCTCGVFFPTTFTFQQIDFILPLVMLKEVKKKLSTHLFIWICFKC